MADFQLNYKIAISGAENVKQKIKDINAEYEQYGTVSKKSTQGLKEALRETKSLSNNQAMLKNVYLASNPVIASFTRNLSVLGRVARSVMSITNALNLANLALAGNGQQVAEAQQALAIATKEYMDALSLGDPAKIADAQKNLGDAIAKLKDAQKQATDQMIQNWITLGATGLFALSSLAEALVALAPKFKAAAKLLEALAVATPYVGIFLLVGALVLLGDTILEKVDPSFQKFHSTMASVLGDNIFNDFVSTVGYAFAQIPFNITKALNSSIKTFEDWEYFQYQMSINIQNFWIDIQNGIRAAINFITLGLSNLEILDQKVMMHRSSWDALNSQVQNAPPGSVGSGAFQATSELDRLRGNYKEGDISTGGSNAIDLLTSSIQETISKIQDSMPKFSTTGDTTSDKMIAQAEELLKNTKAVTGMKEVTDYQTEQQKLLNQTYMRNNVIADNVAKTEAELVKTNNNLIQALNNPPKQQTSGSSYKAPSGFVSDNRYGGGGYVGSNFKVYASREEAAANGAAASGFEGVISRPTTMKMGEAGAEKVSIKPIGASSATGSKNVTVNVYAAGSILTNSDLKRTLDKYIKDSLKGVGFD